MLLKSLLFLPTQVPELELLETNRTTLSNDGSESAVLYKLIDEIRAPKVTLLVICLFALRHIPIYLCHAVTPRADSCKFHSQALLLTGL